MCGRFALFALGQDVADQFGVVIDHEIEPRYNIAPTQAVAAVRLDAKTGERELTYFLWGLIPSWAKDPKIGSRMINARSETAAEKPSFRAAFKRRRCLIPASGFYEWQRLGDRKQPTFIHSADRGLMGLAGLWEVWHGSDGSVVESCTILTTGPNELMTPIHDRMPVIIAPEDYGMWLDPGPRPQDGLHLMRPYASADMAAYAVSPAVNSPGNDYAACVEPL